MVKNKLLINNLIELLKIASPTYSEHNIYEFIKNRIKINSNKYKLLEFDNSMIVLPKKNKIKSNNNKKHISLIGHLDVVPNQLIPIIKGNKIYGAGASDMKGSLASFIYLIDQIEFSKYDISWVFYSREENTPLSENGLFSLINKFPSYFNSIDLAIVGEPTDYEIHLGCVGSIHSEIFFVGKSCHSARPWQGINALYLALPFINNISVIKPEKYNIFGVDFYDVIQITESQSEFGRTSIPGKWICNFIFRYSPSWNDKRALSHFKKILIKCGAKQKNIVIKDQVPAGRIQKSPFFEKILKKLAIKINAKQAWTDVAQLSRLKIPAFNFGPGLTNKCHTNNEYLFKSDLIKYTNKLVKVLQ